MEPGVTLPPLPDPGLKMEDPKERDGIKISKNIHFILQESNKRFLKPVQRCLN